MPTLPTAMSLELCICTVRSDTSAHTSCLICNCSANVQSPTAREGTTRPVSSMSPPTSVVPLVKAIKTPVIQPEEKAYTGIAGRNPLPLSPDALTAFSNGDPDARERNRCVSIVEVHHIIFMMKVDRCFKSRYCSRVDHQDCLQVTVSTPTTWHHSFGWTPLLSFHHIAHSSFLVYPTMRRRSLISLLVKLVLPIANVSFTGKLRKQRSTY